jgi:hypothetical protein
MTAHTSADACMERLQMLWISSLFQPKVHTTAHTSWCACMIHRRTLCCLWSISVGAARMPYDRPNNQGGRMFGHLLFCFFRNFTFSTNSRGVSSNIAYRHNSRHSNVSTTHDNFAQGKGLIRTTLLNLTSLIKTSTLFIETKTKTYFSTLFAWVASHKALVFGRIA